LPLAWLLLRAFVARVFISRLFASRALVQRAFGRGLPHPATERLAALEAQEVP
jgi:hypothetical protein